MKKLFYLFLITAIICSTLCIGAAAYSDNEGEDTYEPVGANEYSEPYLPEKSTMADTSTDTDSDLEEDSVENSENFFALVYDELVIHADKILSALAFIGSLILAFAYKQGLIPVIRTALSNMGTKVGELKDSAEKSMVLTEESINSITEKLSGAEDLIGALNDRLLTLEKELSENEEEKKERRSMITVLIAQVDMLYEIFMSSSLPAYQKDMVGDKINEMKKAISERNGEN